MWESKYIGGEYTQAHDCVWWVRKIHAEQTGFELPNVAGLSETKRAKSLLGVAKERFAEVNSLCALQPLDIIIMRWVGGDDEIHLGIYSGAEGGGVVHAVDKSGVIFRSMTDMRQNGWEIVRGLRLIRED